MPADPGTLAKLGRPAVAVSDRRRHHKTVNSPVFGTSTTTDSSVIRPFATVHHHIHQKPCCVWCHVRGSQTTTRQTPCKTEKGNTEELRANPETPNLHVTAPTSHLWQSATRIVHPRHHCSPVPRPTEAASPHVEAHVERVAAAQDNFVRVRNGPSQDSVPFFDLRLQ